MQVCNLSMAIMQQMMFALTNVLMVTSFMKYLAILELVGCRRLPVFMESSCKETLKSVKIVPL
jgi:hypothetical protein